MAAPPGAGQPGLTHSAAPGAGSSFCGMAPSPPRNDDENDELLEIIVFKCREVTVYKIPPRSARGHKAETWEDVLWKGKLEIVTKGRDFAAVRLADSNTGKLFAVCPLPRKHAEAVERTADSSRFFVLRLDNGKGRRAYVGIGFQDRNDAFDFACALSDEERRRQATMEYAAQTSPLKAELMKARFKKGSCLAEEEETHVELRGFASKPSNTGGLAERSLAALSESGGGFTRLLPPPPNSDWSGAGSTLGASLSSVETELGQPSDTLLSSIEFTEFQRAS